MPPPDLLTSERQLEADDLGDHIDRLYRAAWSLCGLREDAEDLVQFAVDIAGLSYQEAARRLHVREATLTTRVHRGRRRLADNLGIA
jgi:DNA-directed RNA polymerase specialized sigma24 family protein